MNKMKYILLFCCFISINQVKAQQQYIANFSMVNDFSDWLNYKQGYITNSLNPAKSVFDNLHQFGNQFTHYSQSYIDPQAQNYASNYDSIVYIFKYKTTGYAKNFTISFDWLSGSGVPLLYNNSKTFSSQDSQIVRVKYLGFSTSLSFNCRLGLTKTDTTLNNFSVTLSDLDIKGYINNKTTGIKKTDKEIKFGWNNDALFFDKSLFGKEYWITDVVGKQYHYGMIDSEKIELNLENGIYIIRTKSASHKIIINKY